MWKFIWHLFYLSWKEHYDLENRENAFFYEGSWGLNPWPCTCEADSLPLTCISRPWNEDNILRLVNVISVKTCKIYILGHCVCARALVCVLMCDTFCAICKILLSKWFMIFWFYKSTCSWSLQTLFISSERIIVIQFAKTELTDLVLFFRHMDFRMKP